VTDRIANIFLLESKQITNVVFVVISAGTEIAKPMYNEEDPEPASTIREFALQAAVHVHQRAIYA
jgi:hypothetical protein